MTPRTRRALLAGCLYAAVYIALTGLLLVRFVPDMRRSAINRALLYGAVALHLLLSAGTRIIVGAARLVARE